ncbi:MAG: DUF2723 domain-containing protein [Bacteroidetes bacterium]|nr:DUF2723 domain-containing protein [Bacteroidota bacterium]
MFTNEFKKLNNIVGWAVFLISAFAYCSTIEPTASFWDCGEYIACAYRLEVGHPPGAPMFLLIGRFFTLFSFGDPSRAAMMVNIMSALCSAFTILFLFWSITRLAIKCYKTPFADLSKGQHYAILGAATVGSLAYTFSDSFWFSAVEGEVYAMSSFFTAIVFWAILKWEEEDSLNPVGSLRWIVLICFLIGASIGVHLLNLLVIPAIGFIVYFKKYKFSWKGFIIAGIVSVFVLAFVQNLLITKFVKFLSDYEVFFVNKMGMPFNSGTLIYFILIISSLVFFIMYSSNANETFLKRGLIIASVFTLLVVISGLNGSDMFWRLLFLGGALYAVHYFRKKYNLLNTIFLGLATILIGFSTFFVLVIRSQANTPMDENDPENAPNMLSYLLREQYGDWPILYGPYYNAPTRPRSEFGDGTPIFGRDNKTKKYRLIDARKNTKPVYEKDFCTVFPRMWSEQGHHVNAYKYWGDVDKHHKTISGSGRDGEPQSYEVPTMMANLKYFIRYQFNFMYWRYFGWNFVGRQNDIQGYTQNPLEGNTVSGIKFLDDISLGIDSSKTTYRDKNNFASNHFYALPLLLGILGLFFQYKKDKFGMWVVFCVFFFTGLAIVIYLNQYPYQPRERDYAYAGSFYAFAIWIGFGVLMLYEWLSQKTKGLGAAYGSIAIGLVIPGIMAKEGWNDHDRSLRTLARDCAINYLQSCAPNAILFTNGDNDTFPLWYAQDVEGIRTDVRVVNLSLLQTDWYIRQMRRKAYDSDPVPFNIPEEKLEADKLSYAYISAQDKNPVDLKKAMTYLLSSDPANKYDVGGGNMLDLFPARALYYNVDSMAVMKNKVIDVKDTARLAKRIEWDLGGRNTVLKNDIMILDLILNNDWKRPIYFAVTTGDDAYIGLKKYFQLEGLAYRFVPIRQNQREEMSGGRVNTDAMYDNVMNKFKWGGQDKKGVNLDENCTRMTGNLRMQMSVLASALINEGKNKKAEAVLDKCLQVMPDENIPYDATVFTICANYYELKKYDKANALAQKLFDIFEGDLRMYMSLPGSKQQSFYREMEQAKEILKRIVSITEQNNQAELSKKFMARLQPFLTAEDTAAQHQAPQVPVGQ